jgi:parvulin-like peptidyl-prolyl isomerase
VSRAPSCVRAGLPGRAIPRTGALRALVFLLLVLLSHPTFAAQPPDEVANTVAVRVNGQSVSLAEVESVFADSWQLIQDKLRRGELRPEQRAGAVREMWGVALQTAVQDALLDELGAAHREEIIQSFVSRSDPSVPPTRMMEKFRRLEADEVRHLREEMVKSAGGEKELRAALARKGQTLQEWEAGLKRELFRREVLYMNLGYIPDSPAAARAYFEAHPEKFVHPDAWRLRRIRIPKAKFTTPEAAAQAVKLIRAKVTDDQSFAVVAHELAYDPPYDARGGLLTAGGQPYQPSGTFPAEERIAGTLKDGEISQPVDAGEAFLIVLREGFRPGTKPTFEEVAEQAAGLCYTDRLKKKKEEFFERQKKDAFLEVLQKEPPAKYLK